MKYGIKSALPILLLVVLAGATSCLKDVKGTTDPAGSNNVVEFQNSSVPVSYISLYPQYANQLALTGDTSGYNVNFNYVGPQFTAPQDITITIAVDTAALNAFNNSNSPVSTYVLPPPDTYTLPTSIVIPKDSQQVITRVTITVAADFDFNANYCLPLTITASSFGIISTNFGTAMYTFGVLNAYDGIYTVENGSTMVDAFNSSLTEYPTPFQIQLVTDGPTSVAMYDGINVTDGYYHPITTASGGNVYGDFAPVFTIDPTSNKVTSVVNYYGQPAADGRSAEIDPSGVNTYTPSNGTIQVSYWMDQPADIVPHRSHFVETFVYSGPR